MLVDTQTLVDSSENSLFPKYFGTGTGLCNIYSTDQEKSCLVLFIDQFWEKSQHSVPLKTFTGWYCVDSSPPKFFKNFLEP